MKSSRLLIAIPGATIVVVLVAVVVWQARIIRSLRMDQAELRQDLRSAVTAVDRSPESAAGDLQRDRLELIKLRHETRALRESLAEARAVQPNTLKGLMRTLLPPGSGPMQLQPEWKGMEQQATNNYAQAISGVNNGTNEYVRFLSLPKAAKMSFAIGRKEEAKQFAEEALMLNEKYSRGSAEKANGDALHDANVVLGRIAAEEGRLDDAKRHLLEAGRSAGSPVLGSFGPNMGLAKDLLERGEQETVLEYFELCRKSGATRGSWMSGGKMWKREGYLNLAEI